MDPKGVEQGDLAGGGGALEEGGGGGGEEGTNIGAEGEGRGLGAAQRGHRLGREVEQVGGVLAVCDDAEGGLLHGHGAAEGLDVAAALDLGQVSGDLLLGDGAGGRHPKHRLRVSERLTRLPGLLEHRVQPRVLRVLRDRLAHSRLRRPSSPTAAPPCRPRSSNPHPLPLPARRLRHRIITTTHLQRLLTATTTAMVMVMMPSISTSSSAAPRSHS